MEQALQQWGPAAATLIMLSVIVRWFMSFIEGQAIRIESMTNEFNITIRDHLIKSTEALTATNRAVDELCHILKVNGNNVKIR